MEATQILFLILAIAALGAATWAVWKSIGTARRTAAMEIAQRELTEQLHGLTAGALGQGQTIAKLQEELGRTRSRIEQFSSNDSGGAALNQAIRMARRGLSADEIMETCGLSRMEADLVVLLHNERRAE